MEDKFLRLCVLVAVFKGVVLRETAMFLFRRRKISQLGLISVIPCPAEPRYIYPAFANSVDPDQLASEEAS